MLATQKYEGHLSIHDDKTAAKLGLAGAPIEGPTHFSQFVPMLHEQFGDAWFERGCISAHYQNMVVEGEEVRAFVEQRQNGDPLIRIGAEKRDGTPVLTGTASLGPAYGDTEISQRIARLRPPAIMDFDQRMGDLYPFTLNQKLAVITEPHPYYRSEQSRWTKPVIPIEMISVLTQHTSNQSEFRTKGPALGLFAGQEIRLIAGPLYVNHPYKLEREIIALSESRRTESMWIKTSIIDAQTNVLVAETILNSATMKDSYAGYEAEAKALGKNIDS